MYNITVTVIANYIWTKHHSLHQTLKSKAG